MKVRYSRVSRLVPEYTREPLVTKAIVKTQTKKFDVVPCNQRIAAAAKDRNLSHALEQWDRIECEGGVPTPHTYCAMVNAFVRCGQLSRAEEFVAKMEALIPVDGKTREGHIITLTALLKGYFMSSEFKRSHSLFRKLQMTAMGKLGSRTLDTYLRGCLRTGAIEEGLLAFNNPKVERSSMSSIYASKMLAIRLAPKSAAELSQEDASVCIHIGSAYVRLGKLDRATGWFGKAKELLFISTPERQFDQLQRSEMIRACEFFSNSQANKSPFFSAERLIQQVLFIAPSEQVSGWKALGLEKYLSNDQIAHLAASAADAFHARISAHADVVIEVCSGLGEWICREAAARPNTLFVAVEFRFDRCVDMLTRLALLGLSNLLILVGDCRRLPSLIPPHCVKTVHVNYPEPPPVNMSHVEEAMSSDVITKKFLSDMQLILLVGVGKLEIVTDDKLYANSVATLLSDVWGSPVFPKASKTQVDSYFARFFSKKAKRYLVESVVPPVAGIKGAPSNIDPNRDIAN